LHNRDASPTAAETPIAQQHALFITRHGGRPELVGFIAGDEKAAEAWCKKGNAFFLTGWTYLHKWTGEKQPPTFSFQPAPDLTKDPPL
jgi:hypothetical protein